MYLYLIICLQQDAGVSVPNHSRIVVRTVFVGASLRRRAHRNTRPGLARIQGHQTLQRVLKARRLQWRAWLRALKGEVRAGKGTVSTGFGLTRSSILGDVVQMGGTRRPVKKGGELPRRLLLLFHHP